ncbi:MAG: 30S ribosomal protein S13 [Candidatus Diapherotrites archaeon]|nr:30S ribosomal protein S13 [Candidatus Diapherotrites archaeon]
MSGEKKKPEYMEHIVRIADKDLNGSYPIARALTGVKGISFSFANAIARKFGEKFKVAEQTKLGELTEEQIKVLSDIIADPSKYGIPSFMLNRRKSRETGKDIHLTGHELDFKVKEDITIEKKTRSYKGIRHQVGLSVRGQRTRTSGRKGATVGVKKTARMKKAQKR